MTLEAGTRLGAYEILGRIGAGGMGEVYRARDTRLSRDVAIKVLPSALSGDAGRLARFEREARAASALNHPNIVTVFDVGQADGNLFIAMELLEGKILSELIGLGPLAPKKLLSTAAQIADGLASAHEAGIVHRDLKPENIMVTRDGFAKILDFGVAKLARVGFDASDGMSEAKVTQTEAGVVLGTAGYMSPEQAGGEPVDFRSDQFSFGAILYEMLTGGRAFERATPAQTLTAIIEAEPDPAPKSAAARFPESLTWILERCLAKEPRERYAATRDLARDVAAVRDRFSETSSSGPAPARSRRLRRFPAAVAAAAIATGGIAAVAFFAGGRAQVRRDREAPPPKRTTLTFRRGIVHAARFAPDGQTIVYSAAWDGKPGEIFTTRVGSTESRSLGLSPARIEAVSSTGEMAMLLGCSDERCGGTLARAPLAGGPPREILEKVIEADWSPDGKDLAVILSGDDTGDRLEYPVGKALYRGGGILSSVRVSPRGDLVAFLEYPRPDIRRGILTVVDRVGRKRVLTDEWVNPRPLLWSPTGEEVFFSRWGGGETRGADLSGRTRSASWIPGLDDVSREGRFLDSGKFLENYRRVILAFVPGAAEERDLSWLSGSTAADFSGDGREILLFDTRHNPDEPDAEVFTTFLRPTTGSDPIRLGAGKALALSPDAKWALVSLPTPKQHLVLLPTGAGEARPLSTGDSFPIRATFFPDGRRILVSGRDGAGSPRSFIQDLEGGLPKPFGDPGLDARLVSPDGREIAAATAEGFLMLYSSDGAGRPRRIPGAQVGDSLVEWSSDGKTIFVSRMEEGSLALYRLDLVTGRRDRWKRLAPPAGFVDYVHWRPVVVARDGSSYAYNFFADESRLVVTDVGPSWWK
ncbi:MAG TPA: protein kinase [Thermoanaerobaculia bacterium]|nr:protein kinase [Thermoanaerobaculia bacterium]